MHRQQQLVFRNFQNPLNAIWLLLRQVWHWRAVLPARRRLLPALPIALVASVYAVGFALFSTFAASQLTHASGSLRLVKPPARCGDYPLRDFDSLSTDDQIVALRQTATITLDAAEYADSCYASAQSASFSSARCNRYRAPQLNFTAYNVDACPFNDFCIKNNSRPLVLDTGFVDSYDGFGFNAAPQSRIEFRRKAVCSPVDPTPFMVNTSTSDYNGVQYAFGGAREANYTFTQSVPRGDPVSLIVSEAMQQILRLTRAAGCGLAIHTRRAVVDALSCGEQLDA